MKLLFALGNPGPEYSGTRHNLGFAVASAVVEGQSASFSAKAKLKADIAEFRAGDEKIIVARPNTFYNLVGESFRAIMDFYKLEAADCLVIHDELALPFGTLRVRQGGSDAGNNGIKSINAHGGHDTMRLRIGISNDQRAVMGDTDFVLAKLSKEEAKQFSDAIQPKALEIINRFVTDQHDITSHTLV